MKFTDELTLLLKARYPVIFINTIEEDRVEYVIRKHIKTNLNDNNGQLAFNITETYLEGDELTLKVTSTDGNTIYHRNKIFVTDQTPQYYNING